MYHTIVTLKKGEGRTIKSGGAWVYDNEIDTITGRFHNGDMVTVHDFDGYPMGNGFINQNSKIRIRMMTRKSDQEVDEAFLRMRVQNAWDYRKTTVDTSSCRIIFGEADFLPGLVIDKYEDVLVVECLALGMEQFKETIVSLLKEIPCRRWHSRSAASMSAAMPTRRTKEGLPKVKQFIGEEFDTNVEIVGEWCALYGRCGKRSEDRLLPGPEIQPPCHAADLQRQKGTGLLHPHGNLCTERRNRRSFRSNRA